MTIRRARGAEREAPVSGYSAAGSFVVLVLAARAWLPRRGRK